jgi:hypothetical protein
MTQRSTFSHGNEILTDGRTVWVNGLDGACLGRFSKNGYEIMNAGTPPPKSSHYLLAEAGPTDLDDWEVFCVCMMGHHNIDVPFDYAPDFLDVSPVGFWGEVRRTIKSRTFWEGFFDTFTFAGIWK